MSEANCRFLKGQCQNVAKTDGHRHGCTEIEPWWQLGRHRKFRAFNREYRREELYSKAAKITNLGYNFDRYSTNF